MNKYPIYRYELLNDILSLHESVKQQNEFGKMPSCLKSNASRCEAV